jgi:hypothetical protein
MSASTRSFGGPDARIGRPGPTSMLADPILEAPKTIPPRVGSPELNRALAEVRGQAQFLLYVADQLEDALHQLVQETDPGHGAFLCKMLAMYSSQLESKHQGLGDKIAETCQEVYVTVREFDAA